MAGGKFAKLLGVLRARVAAQRRALDDPNDGLPFAPEEFAALVRSRDPSATRTLAAGLSKSPSNNRLQ
jgi:hypothetical protein